MSEIDDLAKAKRTIAKLRTENARLRILANELRKNAPAAAADTSLLLACAGVLKGIAQHSTDLRKRLERHLEATRIVPAVYPDNPSQQDVADSADACFLEESENRDA